MKQLVLFCLFFYSWCHAMDIQTKLDRSQKALKVLKIMSLHWLDDENDTKPRERSCADVLRNSCFTVGLAGLYTIGYGCYLIPKDQCLAPVIIDEIVGNGFYVAPDLWHCAYMLDDAYDRTKLLVAQLKEKQKTN